MSEWRKVPIGELCDSISDTYSGKDAEVILINTSDVLDGKILNHVKTLNKNLKGQFKKTFKKNDILYSEIRPANKRFAFVEIEDTSLYIASTKLMVIRPKVDVVEPRYLFALLKSKQMIDELQHLAESRSGTFPQITFKSELATKVINLPTQVIQKKIISIVDAIEEKIDKNLQINDNLQQQAQIIYSKMCIENADDSWSHGVLSDIAEITMGQSPKGDTYNEVGIGTVFFQGRAEFGFRFPTRRLYTTAPKRMAQANDILLSVRAPVGDFNVAVEPCCIGRGLGAIHSKDGHQSFVLYAMFALRQKLDMFNGEGTVFGSINRDALKSIEIMIPPASVMDCFEETVAPIDTAIRNNYEEICRLEAVRDSLLPRLMSGEIDISSLAL